MYEMIILAKDAGAPLLVEVGHRPAYLEFDTAIRESDLLLA
jgi:hypothetical protein